MRRDAHTSTFIWIEKLFAFIYSLSSVLLQLLLRPALSSSSCSSLRTGFAIYSCLSFPVNHQLLCCNLLWVGQIRATSKLFAHKLYLQHWPNIRVRHIHSNFISHSQQTTNWLFLRNDVVAPFPPALYLCTCPCVQLLRAVARLHLCYSLSMIGDGHLSEKHDKFFTKSPPKRKETKKKRKEEEEKKLKAQMATHTLPLGTWNSIYCKKWITTTSFARVKWAKWPHTDFHKFVSSFDAVLGVYSLFFLLILRQSCTMRAIGATLGNVSKVPQKFFCVRPKVRPEEIQIDRFDFFIHTRAPKSCLVFIHRSACSELDQRLWWVEWMEPLVRYV